jgi:hypothetical protein
MHRSMPIDHHVLGQVRAWAVAVAMLLLVLLDLPGCDWPNDDSDSGRNYRDRLASVGGVSAPDSAALGSVFYVTIGTNASNGCWQQGRDKVQVRAPLLVRITPYDREYISDVCPQNAPTFQHIVPVTAPEAGKLKIEVLRRLRAVSGKDSIGVIEKFVTVY